MEKDLEKKNKQRSSNDKTKKARKQDGQNSGFKFDNNTLLFKIFSPLCEEIQNLRSSFFILLEKKKTNKNRWNEEKKKLMNSSSRCICILELD